jgi:hypothetical protein
LFVTEGTIFKKDDCKWLEEPDMPRWRIKSPHGTSAQWRVRGTLPTMARHLMLLTPEQSHVAYTVYNVVHKQWIVPSSIVSPLASPSAGGDNTAPAS